MSGEGGKRKICTQNKCFLSESYACPEIIKQPFRAIFFANSSRVSKKKSVQAVVNVLFQEMHSLDRIVSVSGGVKMFQNKNFDVVCVCFIKNESRNLLRTSVNLVCRSQGLLDALAVLFGNKTKQSFLTKILKTSIACKG